MKKLGLLVVLLSASRCFAGSIGACVSGSTLAQLLGTTCSIGTVGYTWDGLVEIGSSPGSPPPASSITLTFQSLNAMQQEITVDADVWTSQPPYPGGLGPYDQYVEIDWLTDNQWGTSSAETQFFGADLNPGASAAAVFVGCGNLSAAAGEEVGVSPPPGDPQDGNYYQNPGLAPCYQGPTQILYGAQQGTYFMLGAFAWESASASLQGATFTVTDATPEASTLLLLGTGCLLLLLARKISPRYSRK